MACETFGSDMANKVRSGYIKTPWDIIRIELSKPRKKRDENKLEVDHAVPYIKLLPNIPTAELYIFLQAHTTLL